MILTALFKGSVIPAVLAVGILAAAGFLPAVLAQTLRRIAFPLAFSCGFFLLYQFPKWPPAGSVNSLFYVAWICFLWTFIEATGGRHSSFLRWLFWGLLVFLTLQPLLVGHRLTGDLPFVEGDQELLIHILILIFLGQTLWRVYEKGRLEWSTSSLMFLSIIVMTGLSLSMLFSGSGLMSQLAGTYCALHGGALLLFLLGTRFHAASEILSFTVGMLFSFAVLSFHYLEISLFNLLLLLLPWGALWWKPKLKIFESIWLQILWMGLVSLIPIGYSLAQLYQDYGTGY